MIKIESASLNVSIYEAEDENPGCQCGMADALVRDADGVTLCANELPEYMLESILALRRASTSLHVDCLIDNSRFLTQ